LRHCGCTKSAKGESRGKEMSIFVQRLLSLFR
jgi:hypothetical protein